MNKPTRRGIVNCCFCQSVIMAAVDALDVVCPGCVQGFLGNYSAEWNIRAAWKVLDEKRGIK